MKIIIIFPVLQTEMKPIKQILTKMLKSKITITIAQTKYTTNIRNKCPYKVNIKIYILDNVEEKEYDPSKI